MRRFSSLQLLVAIFFTLVASRALALDWTQTAIESSCSAPYKIDAGDIDGDGDMDLLVSVAGGTFSWYENDGSPDVGEWLVHPVSSTLTVSGDANLADMDGDGDLDAVGSHPNVWWFENDGSPQDGFIQHDVSASAVANRTLIALPVDIDKDGDLDIISGKSSVALLLNDGSPANGGWTEITVSDDSGSTYDMRALDMDGDGDKDIAVVGQGFLWFENDGQYSGAAWTAHVVDSASGLSTRGLDVADMDGDGIMDFVVGLEQDDLVWFRGCGAEACAFTKYVVEADYWSQSYGTVGDVVVADLDQDGDPDILVPSQDFNDVPNSQTGLAWYENDGSPLDGGWTRHRFDYGLSNRVSGAVVADINRDGCLDIAAADFNTSLLSMWTQTCEIPPPPEVDLIHADDWSADQGDFLIPGTEAAISANIGYQLETQSSADLELAVYQFDADGQTGRFSWSTRAVANGDGSEELSSSFTVPTGKTYMMAAACLRAENGTLLTPLAWSHAWPVIDPTTANPATLYNWPPNWTAFNSEKVRLFNLLGNAYAFTTARTTVKGTSLVIPLLGRFNAQGQLERFDDDANLDEWRAVATYALLRFGGFDYYGFLGYQGAWEGRAEAMRDAALRTDPADANGGVLLISAGKSLFMIGLGGLTTGMAASSISSILSTAADILEFGSFLNDLYSDILTSPDLGDDLAMATRAIALASPSALESIPDVTKALLESYIASGARTENEFLSISKNMLEALTMISEGTDLANPDLVSDLWLVIDNSGVHFEHWLKGPVQVTNVPRLLQASGLCLLRTTADIVLEDMADVGPYARNMLASLQFHYNALSVLAQSIANDIESLGAETDPLELQERLALLTLKISTWHSCMHETNLGLLERLRTVDGKLTVGWMISESELAELEAEADYWLSASTRTARELDRVVLGMEAMIDGGGVGLTPVMRLLLNNE